MRLGTAVAIVVVLAASAVQAQDQPAPPPPAIPPQPAPAPIVLENTGTPMVLPLQCTKSDIEWAGLSCSEEEPCTVYLELSAVETAGSTILAVGDIHSAAVTLYSVALASPDGGRTWREAHPRIRGASLDHIQFLDAEHGWISGIVFSPLPQDPFLLLTSDGAKTWKQASIFNDSRESRTGAIQQFSFAARDDGSLIVDRGAGSEGDRYELYESPDGGQTWMIKEESIKPLKLKRPPPPPSADWRIRVDSPSQSFHIEHRQGARWTSVAAFAVKLGPCKPEEPPAPEAPK